MPKMHLSQGIISLFVFKYTDIKFVIPCFLMKPEAIFPFLCPQILVIRATLSK
jgi:hypothetical protein